MSLSFQLGRKLGRAALPAIRTSKWLWQTLAGRASDPIQAETEFGAALAAQLRLRTGISRDPADAELVNDIGRRLSACLRNKRRIFKTEVLLDDSPMAVAIPGGFVFASTGLLRFCARNAHELAFLIGHEMGHIVRGHALERLLQRIGAEGVSTVLSRGLLNSALDQTSLQWLETAHSTETEYDADEFGLRVAAAARYDIRATVQLLERQAAQRQAPGASPHYFASHPPELERLKNLEQALGKALPRS
jgi:predicted Zn-dependent protease